MHKIITIVLLFSCFTLPLFGQNEITTAGIPGDINGKFQDVRPVISDDGDLLYLTRRNHPENIKGTKDFQDVWVSRYDSRGIWLKPKNLGKQYNDKRANDLVRASKGSEELVFINTKYKGVSTELAMFSKGSDRASEMKIEGFYNKSPYVDFDYNFENKVIIMAVERNDSKGDQDLYFSTYNEETGAYTTPTSMGSLINSKKADFAPFLSNDGRTIFFASYGHDGYGNADIFMSHRLSESWDDWSEPKNLGNVINTSNEETFVSVDPSFEYLYYDTYPPGAKNRDIWRAELSQEIKDALIAARDKSYKKIQGVNAATADASEMTSSSGSLAMSESSAEVKDDQSAQDETVSDNPVENEESSVAIQEETAPPSEQEIEARKLAAESQQFVAKQEESKSFLAKVGQSLGFGSADKPIGFSAEGGKGIQITENIYFQFNSDQVEKEYNDLLDQIAALLKQQENYKLLLEGHTDGIGGEDVNIDLSCRRAKEVRLDLIERGINRYRLEISCEGKERPLASNDDEFEGRELNRRVEFYLY